MNKNGWGKLPNPHNFGGFKNLKILILKGIIWR
jgi:hypothetical protein